MADSISAMPKEIAQWLSEQTAVFGSIRFLTEFPPIPKATPLKNTIVSVGLESVKITDSFVENSNGELVAEEYCRHADIKVRFSVYVPYSAGGTACHEAFTKIVDCLNFKSDLNLKESGCDAIEADRDTDAFVMKSWIIIEAEFCPAESSNVQYEAFMPKTLFCNSHMNDKNIHVTPEDKASWGAQTVSGTFFGTGTSEQSINLGFKPKFVFVGIAVFPLFWTESDGTSHCCSAAATQTYGSAGLKITANGFKVIRSSSINEGTTVVEMNKTGEEYVYIAFK